MSEELTLVPPSSDSLPMLVQRAGDRLIAARSSAEVLEAKKLAELALHYAKVTKAANDTHADCLRIITRAEIRMADEVDRGQAAGEVAKVNQPVSQYVRSPDIPVTLPDLGVPRQRLSEWREVRDAGQEIIEQAIGAALAEGRPPTKSEILDAARKINREDYNERKRETQERRALVAANIPDETTNCRIFRGDISDLLTEPRESVDIICTDPPYPREFLGLYETLGAVAFHLLKPNGILLCMTGQSYLPDVIASLARHLNYHWTIAYLTPGGQAVQIFPRKVNTFWKPVLVFCRGDYADDWFGDVAKSAPNDNDKSRHEWGQSESGITDLMARFLRPGMTVADPFLGGGTTAVVALKSGASFLGCDIDETCVATTKARLADAGLV